MNPNVHRRAGHRFSPAGPVEREPHLSVAVEDVARQIASDLVGFSYESAILAAGKTCRAHPARPAHLASRRGRTGMPNAAGAHHGGLVMAEPGSPLMAFSDHVALLVERASASIVAVHGGRGSSSGIHWRPGVIVTAEEVFYRDG